MGREFLIIIVIAGLVFIGVALYLRYNQSANRSSIHVTVNGHQVTPKTEWRLDHDQVVGSVTSVASALDADTQWNESTGSLTITSESPWIPNTGAINAMEVSPFDPTAVGPIITVRNRLSDQQWASLNNGKSLLTPLLTRFEIVNAMQLYIPGGSGTPLTVGNRHELDNQGFRVQAYLYWAYYDQHRNIPRGGTGYLRITGDANVRGSKPYVHQLRKIRVDHVSYFVVPNKAEIIEPTDITIRKGMKHVEALVWGKDGWTIKEEKILSANMFLIADNNNMILPYYDVSFQRIDNTGTYNIKK